LYGQQQIDEADLHVPHKGISERAFVLYPLAEIAPNLDIPNHGHIAKLLTLCPKNNLER
jgi:2-amino-4-hydroxy-6-hydroxymethyldihydropteridine diphosphokinase